MKSFKQAETLLCSVSAWMPHAYRAARSISCFALCLGFVRVLDWNMWKSVTKLRCAFGRWAAKPKHRPTAALHGWPSKVRQVVYRSKTRMKWWFSSQRWPLSKWNPAKVLPMDDMHPHAKFRCHTSHRFRGDRGQRFLATLSYYIDEALDPAYHHHHHHDYYNHFMDPWTVSGTTWVSRYQKGKTNLDLLEQETVRVSGIS